jgi:hypothetical protein
MKPSQSLPFAVLPWSLLSLVAHAAPASAESSSSSSLLVDVVEIAADGGKTEAHYAVLLDERPAVLQAHGPAYDDRVEASVEKVKGELPLLHLGLKRSREREGCEIRLTASVKERAQVASLALGRGRRLEVFATVR